MLTTEQRNAFLQQVMAEIDKQAKAKPIDVEAVQAGYDRLYEKVDAEQLGDTIHDMMTKRKRGGYC